MSARKKLTNPMMVRMEPSMRGEIESIARANGLTSSDVIRLAIKCQLPAIKSGRVRLQPS